MIINDEEASARLNSPLNLINKLKTNRLTQRGEAMSLFGIDRSADKPKQIEKIKISFNPFFSPQISKIPDSPPQPVLNDILENHESQIKLGLAHDKALELLNRSVEMLSTKLDNVSAARLPSVISAASKTVESIRRERNEASKNSKDREVHYHFYIPEQKKISDYEVIDIVEEAV